MSYPYQPTEWVVPSAYINNDPNVFPFLPGQVFTAQKGPSFNTTIKKAKTGRMVRSSRQSAPIWQFKVAYDFLRDGNGRFPTKPELQRLWGFFCNRQGQFGSFFYWDPWDRTVTNQFMATGDGATQGFQVTRNVSQNNPFSFVEPVYSIGDDAVFTVGGAVRNDWVFQEGVITFQTAPAAGAQILWSGSFQFWCHFTMDALQPEQFVKSLWSLDDGLTFESLIV